MSFFRTDVPLVKHHDKEETHALFFTINSQETFFQLKYYHNMGLDMIQPNLIKFYSSGLPIHQVSLTGLENISTWARSIMSYQRQLPKIVSVHAKEE